MDTITGISPSILSVNPSAKTLGSMHPELTAALLRGREALARRTRRVARVLSTVFAVGASRRSSVFLLLSRVLFGTMFIVMGLCSLGLLPLEVVFRSPGWMAWTEVAAGGALILGLFSRISMATLAVLYCMVVWQRFNLGIFPQTAILCTLGAILNCIAGPGRYSLDTLLCKGLSRLAGVRR